jgi:hypothetical protein
MGQTFTTNKPSRIIFKGGRIIDSGAYGSVIAPAIPCNVGDDTRGKVSKIFFGFAGAAPVLQDKAVETNPELLAILNTIDPHQRMYVRALTEECGNIPFGDLPEETQKDIRHVLRDKAIPESTKNIVFFNLIEITPYPEQIERNLLTFWIKGRNGNEGILTRALRVLHENGIAHNDVHPGNIARGPDNQPRLIDFGRAVLRSQVTEEDFEAACAFDILMLNKLLIPEAPRGGRRALSSKHENRTSAREDGGRRSESSRGSGGPPKNNRKLAFE